MSQFYKTGPFETGVFLRRVQKSLDQAEHRGGEHGQGEKAQPLNFPSSKKTEEKLDEGQGVVASTDAVDAAASDEKKVDVPKNSLNAMVEAVATASGQPGSHSSSSNSVCAKKSAGSRQTTLMQDEIKKAGVRGQIFGSAEDLLAYPHMEDVMESLLQVDSEAVYDSKVSHLVNSKDEVKHLREGSLKAANSVKSHIEGKKRRAAKKPKEEQAKKQADAVLQMKKKAKLAQEQLKAETAQHAKIFSVDFAESLQNGLCLQVPLHDASGAANFTSQIDIEKPSIIRGHPALNKLGSSEAQVALCSYAGSYKKDLKDVVGQRSHKPIWPTDGKASFVSFWANVCTCFPSDKVAVLSDIPEEIKNTVCALWMYGCDNEMKEIKASANGLASLRLMCSGEVESVMFDLKSVIPAMKVLKAVDTFTIDELYAAIGDLSTDGLEQLKTHGAQAYYCKHAKDEILYCPAGYLLVESAVSGSLLYGIRKTMLLTSNSHYQSMEYLVGLYGNMGKNTEKLQMALRCMAGEDEMSSS